MHVVEIHYAMDGRRAVMPRVATIFQFGGGNVWMERIHSGLKRAKAFWATLSSEFVTLAGFKVHSK